MLGSEIDEVDAVQNTALGATVLWQFGLSYQQESLDVPPLLPAMFIVLPLCLHTHTLQVLLSTRKSSGLVQFSSKLGETREHLMAVHARALTMRALSFHSMAMGVRAGLLTINYGSAAVRANEAPRPALPERVKPIIEGASRLGHWCAGLSLRQIVTLLKIQL